MSIAVTMRPRRLSTPAISGADSGTRVIRSGMKNVLHAAKSAGRTVGPPIITVTYSITCSPALFVVVAHGRFLLRPLRPTRRSSLLERRDQTLTIELRDEIVEAGLAAAFDRGRRRDRGQCDDRGSVHLCASARIASGKSNPFMPGISMSDTTISNP